jgi:chromosomal replication initiation ATPase DnaA
MSTIEFSAEHFEGYREDVYEPRVRRKSAQALAEQVARRHGISVEELFARKRMRHLFVARAELYRLLRDQGWSLPAIGAFVGRDHSTVMMALLPVEQMRAKRLRRTCG